MATFGLLRPYCVRNLINAPFCIHSFYRFCSSRELLHSCKLSGLGVKTNLDRKYHQCGSAVKSTGCSFREDSGFILSTHTVASNPFGLCDALFWPPRALHTHGTQTCRQNTYTNINLTIPKVTKRHRTS